MRISVFALPHPDYHNFAGDVEDEKTLRDCMKELENPKRFPWVKNDRKVWINKELENLLRRMIKMEIPNCSIKISPFSREIEVCISYPGDSGGPPQVKISYEKQETPKLICGMLAGEIGAYWEKRKGFLVKALMLTEKVLLACQSY